jgi:phosphosulfolactate synthase (CoM biosynthesis protein A)
MRVAKRVERAFEFVRLKELPPKPRETHVTEIRGSYYTVVGLTYLKDLLDVAADYVDIFKFAGGSQRLHPRPLVKRIIKLCHDYDVRVQTGGFIEKVLTQGPRAVDAYLEETKALGFDIVEVSSGYVTIRDEDKIALVKEIRRLGMKPKPEVNLVEGTGGGVARWDTKGVRPDGLIRDAKTYLGAGAWKIMIESEGITENVKEWRKDVVNAIAQRVGLKNVMFEAAEREVFRWYVQTFGPQVNLFVDHSQILDLTTQRTGLWAPAKPWGRVRYRA